ncbi:MAG TPA: ABC transporter ATP-binding protein [Bryobacteraceae bacterium]|nr:ABC transporter ATP-binding protein [Bryobacteraceae bacterium]
MAAVLELIHVSKLFDQRAAVDDVSFRVERGTLFSLVGPSGCGKSTTLRLIAGLLEVSSGDILLNGKSIAGMPPHQRPINTVFQNYALFPHLTVRGNIAFGLERQSVAPRDIRARVARMAELLRLSGLEDRKPSQLSGGERQRVALARSLVLEPEVLLLDEPLSALDPGLRHHVRRELRELQSRLGTTFILVTHDREEALSMSDTLAVMNGGRVEQIGGPQQLYSNPCTRFVAGFLGAVNWIDEVGVRPEHVRLTQCADASSTDRCRTAIVAQHVYLGSSTQVTVRLSSGDTVQAEVPSGSAVYAPGEPVTVSWDACHEIRGVSR